MSETSSDRPVVLLLGTATAGADLALAFERLGVAVSTAGTVGAPDTVTTVVAEIAEVRPSHVVAASPDVPPEVLLAAAEIEDVEVFPTPRAARLNLDREGLRKLAADELGLPTVPFWFAGSAAELDAVARHAGFPLVVSPVAGESSDGRSVLTRPDDVDAAWQLATARAGSAQRVMAETVVEVDDEVTLLTVRSIARSGPTVAFCEPIGHRRSDGGPLESWQPQQMSPAALDAARSIAARIVNSLGGRGVFSVELLVRGDEVYFSHVRPRPEATGLLTMRSQRLSQFELHARAILGLSLDTIMISPAAAEVLDVGPSAVGVLGEALEVPESDVRVSDGTTIAIATAPDVVRARDRAHRVSSVLRAP